MEKQMKQTLRAAAMLLFAAILAGCSSGPSDSVVEDILTSQSDSFVSISDVERINGYEEGNKYVVDVRYIMTFKQGFQELVNQSSGFDRMGLQMMGMMAGEWEKGDSIEKEESLTFVDSENGWKLL